MTDRNEGIIISGGSVNAGSMAAGPGARVHIGVNRPTFSGAAVDDPEIAQRVATLERSLHDAAAKLADQGSALTQLGALVEELRRPEPRSSRVSAILGTLRDSVGPVSAVLGNIAAIERSLTLLL